MNITLGLFIAFFLAISIDLLAFEFIFTESVSDQTPKIQKYSPSISNPLRFHLIGDFGQLKPKLYFPVLPVQIVSNSMNTYAEQAPISMVVTVGDNFYYYLKSYFSATVFTVMEKIFSHKTLHNVPWYFTYGNHDCRYNDFFGNYLERLYQNINMPSGSWNLTFPIGNTKVSFTFLSCTFPCIGNVESEVTYNECLMSRSKFNQSNEYEWLEKHLKSVSEDKSVLWKIVVLHYPVFSISKSDADDENLKKKLVPILVRYDVDAIFSGHNHNMQYFTMKKNQSYLKQDQSDLCLNDFIMCGEEKVICVDKFTACEDPNVNCSDKRTWNDSKTYPFNDKNAVFKKGNEIHQVVMGASGADLDNLCMHLESPMAKTVFGLADYGFAQIEISTQQMSIKYIHANSSEVVFESTILV